MTAVEYEEVVLYVLNRYVKWEGARVAGFRPVINAVLHKMSGMEIRRIYEHARDSDRRNLCQK